MQKVEQCRNDQKVFFTKFLSNVLVWDGSQITSPFFRGGGGGGGAEKSDVDKNDDVTNVIT